MGETITEVKMEESESPLSEESCDNLPEESSLRDTLWGFLGCGIATEVAVDSEVDIINDATEEIHIEEATEEISIEKATEIEIHTKSETEIEAISTDEPEAKTDKETEEVEVEVEESCDNLPTEPSLRDKLWSFLGCGNAIEEMANSEAEDIKDEILPEIADDVEIKQMETDPVDILTTEEPHVGETEEQTTEVEPEQQTAETLGLTLTLWDGDSEPQTEESVGVEEGILSHPDIQLHIKGFSCWACWLKLFTI